MINYNTAYHIYELEIRERISKLLPLDDSNILYVLSDKNNILQSDIYIFLYRYIRSLNPTNDYPEDILDIIKNYSQNLVQQLLTLSENTYSELTIQLFQTYAYWAFIQQFQFNNLELLTNSIIEIYNLIVKFDNEPINTPIWCCKEELRNLILALYNRYIINSGKNQNLPFNILDQINIVKENISLLQNYINEYIITDKE